ncbi:ATP-binding protein [Paenibacillus lutrae]|uniref:histidine kinase n=1 Tax=Paenibacillus lutrae TaxID=2078573 RepID=A0A7X3FJN0_9BACL|nr:ATP-binding protein [Paenibacillus lutrae]MVP00991.1 response regulator [Paenibacillus lutrae]
MTKSKLFLISGFFVLMLTVIHLLWNLFYAGPVQPHAVRGQLDLRGWDFAASRSVTLNGEWEFYPDKFIDPGMSGSAGAASSPEETRLIQVPGNWKESLHPENPSNIGYGSYRLRILVDPEDQPYLGIQIPRIPASSKIFINGKLLQQTGEPAAVKELYTPRNLPSTAYFANNLREMELILHVANFDNPMRGGLYQSIKLGSEKAINRADLLTTGLQLLICIIFAIHAVYALILYLSGFSQKRQLVYFMLTTLSAIIMTLVDDKQLLLLWLPISYAAGVKLLYVSYTVVALFLLQLVLHVLPQYSKYKVFRWFTWMSVLYVIFVVLAPVDVVQLAVRAFHFVYFPPFLIVTAVTLRQALSNGKDSIYLLLVASALTSSVGWGVAKSLGWAQNVYYPFDLIIGFVAFAAFCLRQFIHTYNRMSEFAQELQKSDKMKDEFLVNTSHELRTPLHGILNIAQQVLETSGPVLDAKSTQNLELLVTVGRRMSLMLGDLLDLTQLREGRVKLQPRSVRIQAAASGVLDMLKFLTEGKKVRFVMDIPASFPPVLADETRLIQILFNLTHNAVKFTDTGAILIRAEIRAGQAYIHVSDTGCGMDEDMQHRVFRPYEQGDAPRSSSAGGLGLGLSICQQMVQLHGGRLTVKSAPGEGSVFTFNLPLAEEARDAQYLAGPQQLIPAASGLGADSAGAATEPAPANPAVSAAAAWASADSAAAAQAANAPSTGDLVASGVAVEALAAEDTARALAAEAAVGALATKAAARAHLEAAAGGSAIEASAATLPLMQHGLTEGRPRILAVDDDPVNLRILGDILLADAYEVVITTSPQEALKLINSASWDLIIADVMMPHISGYELTRLIRERYSISELPVLLLTTRSRPEDIYSGFLAGASEYVTKPVDALELRSRVRALTDLKQSIQDRLSMEAAYLQAQIQPHFLFNTLNSITALSDIDTDKMNDLIEAFSTYLRLSFDFLNSAQLVPLERELELVRCYLYIEKERFDERLTVVWNNEPNLNILLPPLTIQPLVENAVKHGALSLPRGGTVHIRMYRAKGAIRVSIEDNGRGMSAERIHDLLEHPQRPASQGIGLRNTHRRLKQLYGHGLTIDSKQGQGTTVSFEIPRPDLRPRTPQ